MKFWVSKAAESTIDDKQWGLSPCIVGIEGSDDLYLPLRLSWWWNFVKITYKI